jgi:RNA polymerase sigma factor (sigma-70 family)
MATLFRTLSESQIAELEPAAQLAYVHTARAAGQHDAAGLALQLLIWSHRRLIRALVAAKVPPHRVDEATDHCLVECAAAVLRNPPEAENEQHLRGWLASVVRNQVVNWWRRNARHEDPWSLEAPAPGADGERGSWDVPVTDAGFEIAEFGDIVDRRLDALSAMHRRVVELRLFDGLASKAVAERMLSERGETVSPANVDQIATRFRQNCRAGAE